MNEEQRTICIDKIEEIEAAQWAENGINAVSEWKHTTAIQGAKVSIDPALDEVPYSLKYAKGQLTGDYGLSLSENVIVYKIGLIEGTKVEYIALSRKQFYIDL